MCYFYVEIVATLIMVEKTLLKTLRLNLIKLYELH